MAEPIEITVDSAAVAEAFERLEAACRNLRPAMRDIGGLREKETEENFRAQGRPPWPQLSQVTILQRLAGRDKEKKHKKVSGIFRKDGSLRAAAKRRLDGGLMILQDTVNLKNGIRAFPDKVGVTIGSPLKYAAIHQFGGMAGRNRKVRIPKRQFIPIDENGTLTPEAERGVLAALYEHIAESV
ncbi:phage virion morphogenesis protein [uncultured Bilophila sp.]|uniref:phage virion morphogenesis protein n=1 Tax=uncultured Bilophila sp. TaxID=529385 RepID=UPI0026478AEA|nr:phage virion morphogenesis protein [uncultured Bilophila sp.]